MSLFKPLRAAPAILVLVFLLIAGVYVWIRHSGKPWRSGERSIDALQAPVEVRFDRWGVPHVSADHGTDLALALGWLHANDRRTQMELGRRAGRGRLAEALGASVVDVDVALRTLRLAETAERLWHAASPESRSWLEAYAVGVNTWDGSRSDGPPPGMRVLGHLGPWTPQDSLIFSLLMARDLSFWDDRPEEERFGWLAKLGPDATLDLLGAPDAHVPEAIAALAAGAEIAARDGDSAADDASPGSNNWAVAPARAAQGAAMIANDPHLGLHLPAVWYQAHLRSPDYEAAGMTLPGLPGVVIGRGREIAWALTNTMLDDHDVFFEQVETTAESGMRVRRGDTWIAADERTETITVRGGEPIEITLRLTDRGILLDADPERGLPARSLAWTAHLPGDPLAAFRALADATVPDEVLAATETYIAPAQNLVVAFASGDLVYVTLGGVPARRLGDGRLPSPGWDLAYGWDGLRPRSTNPIVVRPADDLLVTANHDIRPEGYALPLTADFMDPFRAMRLHEALDAETAWTREGFAELQVDTVSIIARRTLDALRDDGPYEGDAAQALTAFDGWDARMSTRGPAALWSLLHRELLGRVFGDEAAAAEVPDFGHRHRLFRLLEGTMDPSWWDDVATDAVEDRRAIFEAALAAAWADGRDRWGRDVDDWDYGQLHGLRLAHRLDKVPVYGTFTRRGPYPAPGSASTVLALGAVWEDDVQRITYGPSMRWIVDWSDPERAWAVLPGGQSGHPADRHYDDQIRPFLDGEMHEAPWSEAAIEAATVSTLRLVP
ncbi:MAG: penicillin acylase family protein [Acidobacteriota bacterium]